MNKYDKIINLPYKKSQKYPKMSNVDRAAQFAPFAALTDYDAEIREKGRLTSEKRSLNQEETDNLNGVMARLLEKQSAHPEIEITYFVADKRKSGGEYVTVVSKLKYIALPHRTVHLCGDLIVSLDDVVDIKILE